MKRRRRRGRRGARGRVRRCGRKIQRRVAVTAPLRARGIRESGDGRPSRAVTKRSERSPGERSRGDTPRNPKERSTSPLPSGATHTEDFGRQRERGMERRERKRQRLARVGACHKNRPRATRGGKDFILPSAARECVSLFVSRRKNKGCVALPRESARTGRGRSPRRVRRLPFFSPPLSIDQRRVVLFAFTIRCNVQTIYKSDTNT